MEEASREPGRRDREAEETKGGIEREFGDMERGSQGECSSNGRCGIDVGRKRTSTGDGQE